MMIKDGKKVGIFRYVINTAGENFIYEEADNLVKYKPVFFFKQLEKINRSIEAYHLEAFTKDSNTIYFAKDIVKDFKRFVKKNNIKIFHAQFITDAILYFSFIQNSELPFLVNFRGYELSVPWVRIILSKIFPRIAKIITKSEFQRNMLISQGCDERKIITIYGGINFENIPFLQREIKEEDIKIISAARFVEKKGFETTVNFFSEVRKKYCSARLTLIGNGKEKEHIKSLIRELNLSRFVNVLDFMEHQNFIKELYNHHIFVLPSRTARDGNSEGIPNVIKEAMASGMPVISTYHAGIPELIDDGKTGFLVRENDSHGMVSKFEWILKNKKKVFKMCCNARIFIEKEFDIIKNVNKLELLYDRILCKKKLC